MKKMVTLPEEVWNDLRKKGYFIPKSNFNEKKLKSNKPLNFVKLVKEDLDPQARRVLLGLLLEHHLGCSATDILTMSVILNNPIEQGDNAESPNEEAAKELEIIGEFYWERQGCKNLEARVELNKVLEIETPNNESKNTQKVEENSSSPA